MTQILTKQNYPQPQPPPEKLFTGIFLRWSALTTTEKVVCANIVLLPVWWFVGLTNYLPLSLCLGIVLYERRRYGRVRLKRPSWVVIALFAFLVYGYIDTVLISLHAYPSIDIPPDVKLNPNRLIKSLFGFAYPFLVWYVQSNKIRVRLEVVAWAFSVSIVQMLLIWLVVQIFPGIANNPPRSLYAMLTGKSGFDPENNISGWGNYLVVYYEGRFRFFFAHNQICAAFLGFAGLIALDLKNRVWSLSLLGTSLFLLSLTATRSSWLAFPAVVLIYFGLFFAKMGKAWIMLTILAVVSFVTLSLPPVTNLMFNTSTEMAQSVANARAGSTEIRALVYKETLERIPHKPLFGHKVEGPPAIQGNAAFFVQDSGIRIGSHSFILGNLLYQKGLLGTGIFFAAWGGLLGWFYQTGAKRPMCWFPVLMFFFLQCFVTILNPININTLLLMIIFCSQQKSIRGVRYG